MVRLPVWLILYMASSRPLCISELSRALIAGCLQLCCFYSRPAVLIWCVLETLRYFCQTECIDKNPTLMIVIEQFSTPPPATSQLSMQYSSASGAPTVQQL